MHAILSGLITLYLKTLKFFSLMEMLWSVDLNVMLYNDRMN